jgi:diamine N-acetyltransferase
MIVIKKCDTADIPLLLDIATKSYLETYQYLWDDNGAAYLLKFYSKEVLEHDISTAAATYFLVYGDDNAVGYFKIKDNAPAPYEKKDGLEIEKLYFLKEHTGKGIGKKVMSFIENLAKEQNKSIVWLNVMESSSALSFYEFHGFKQVHRSYLNHPHMKDNYRVLLTYIKSLE